MRIVIALGGNALLERGEKPDAAIELRHIRRAARVIAAVARSHEVIVCHGNGPQVGLLALESEADGALSEPYPLDVLGAQTQGMIGYWLARELRNAGVAFPIVSVVTQVVVDASDPSFAAPTKFIGPIYSRFHAQRLAHAHGWTVAADGAHWRRVVASPQPDAIVELAAIRYLTDDHVLVICGGGGGAPVIETEAGELIGAEAVVDKDLTAALLAAELHADLLLVLTDVPAVMKDFGSDHAMAIGHLDTAALEGLAPFARGSMGPKIEACRRFVGSAGGRRAAIGALDDAVAIVAGRAGTTIEHSLLPSE
jgi:carbamate kinase